MAKYSGDQVAHNPEVVANYLRAAPTTRLATRQIQFLKVHVNGVDLAYQAEAPNSNFAKAVRGIQAQAEVVIIGSPTDGAFIIGVYADTMNDGNISDPNRDYDYAYSNAFARTLAQSVNASLNVNNADVDLVVIRGYEFIGWQRAINYVDPNTTPATIDGTYDYNYNSGHNPGGLSSYENELFTDN
jgi:hypothetical protein